MNILDKNYYKKKKEKKREIPIKRKLSTFHFSQNNITNQTNELFAPYEISTFYYFISFQRESNIFLIYQSSVRAYLNNWYNPFYQSSCTQLYFDNLKKKIQKIINLPSRFPRLLSQNWKIFTKGPYENWLKMR